MLLGGDGLQDVRAGRPPGGNTAAPTPMRAATMRMTITVTSGMERMVRPELAAAWTMAAPRAIPSTRPSTATTTASPRIMARTCRRPIPIERSRPISLVRSITDRAMVLTTPNEAMRTLKASSTYTRFNRVPNCFSDQPCTGPRSRLSHCVKTSTFERAELGRPAGPVLKGQRLSFGQRPGAGVPSVDSPTAAGTASWEEASPGSRSEPRW